MSIVAEGAVVITQSGKDRHVAHLRRSDHFGEAAMEVGLYTIATLEKQLPKMIGKLV
jgi:hypothetical protein